jgi:hypothetical protein
VDADYSLNDYPRDTILELLDTVGLKPDEKFWAVIEEPTAKAYQYKIVAQPGRFDPDQVPSLPQKPDQLKGLHAKQLRRLRKRNETMTQQLAEAREQLRVSKERLEEMQGQLRDKNRQIRRHQRVVARIYASRSW